MKVFIPSKGRPDQCSTLKCFIKNEEFFKSVFLFLEEADVPYYTHYHPYMKDNIITLPESNRGVSFVRDYILNYSESNEDFWMMDDDLKHFGYLDDEGEPVIIEDTLALLKETIEIAKKNDTNIRLIGFDWKRFFHFHKNKRSKDSVTLDSSCVCHVGFINYGDVLEKGLHYRTSLKLREDLDIMAQVIALGYHTALMHNAYFNPNAWGVNGPSGGLKSVYQMNDIERKAGKRLQEIWGSDIVKIADKGNGKLSTQLSRKAVKRKFSTPLNHINELPCEMG